MIGNAVPASSGSTYRWVENGNVLSGTNQATYNVPKEKAVGIYTYVRQSKSSGCPDWQASNEFTVAVFACSFTGSATTGTIVVYVDPRDGKRYNTVKMPDNKIWFAQNLNYTKDLTYNAYSFEANGKQFTSTDNGVPAIGSYWCPPVYVGTPVVSGDESACNVYGALYTWETAMMVDGKYADEAKSNTAWDELWVSSSYLATGSAPNSSNTKANWNAGRGGNTVKGGGRGICPMGWHVPTEYEWANMLDLVDNTKVFTSSTEYNIWLGTNSPGLKLKSASTYTATDPGTGSWLDHANQGSNTTGFGAVPAGWRSNNGSQFFNRGERAVYWSSSVETGYDAWYRELYYDYAQVYRHLYNRSHGFSVRCVKDR
jgi:uncharacterized protein (TIGR02145 family)